jgi:hypothetical protein
VEEWRQSGKSAPEFAAGREFTVSSLRYWATKLRATAARPRAPALARVVQPGRVAAVEARGAPSETDGVEVIVGDARIVVRRGFDPVLVRELVSALGGSR